jgi:hypothetical protein
VEGAGGPITHGEEIGWCIRHSPWYLTHEANDPLWTEFVRALTGSLDAALGLVDRALPGAGLLIGRHQTPETRPWARIGPWHAPDATGATLPLAVLAALLKALSEKDQANG